VSFVYALLFAASEQAGFGAEYISKEGYGGSQKERSELEISALCIGHLCLLDMDARGGATATWRDWTRASLMKVM